VSAPGIELRLLGNDDLDRYRRLRLEALRAEPTAFGSSYEIEASAKADKYRDRLTGSPENYVLGAWDGTQLVGLGGFVRETAPKRAHIGSIWGVYVTPSWRGKGLGRALLASMIERARDLQGLDHVLLSVTSENAAALALYRAFGFVAWGTEPAALKVDGIDYGETHMLLRLSPDGVRAG
jgi:ribosomal protein S18 acetylase RimI-like enzyme